MNVNEEKNIITKIKNTLGKIVRLFGKIFLMDFLEIQFYYLLFVYIFLISIRPINIFI